MGLTPYRSAAGREIQASLVLNRRDSSLASAFPFPPLGAADREQCAGAPEHQRAWLGHEHVLHIQHRSVVRIFARAEPARGEAGILALADEHPAAIGFRV